jgi:hypothetical protein
LTSICQTFELSMVSRFQQSGGPVVTARRQIDPGAAGAGAAVGAGDLDG